MIRTLPFFRPQIHPQIRRTSSGPALRYGFITLLLTTNLFTTAMASPATTPTPPPLFHPTVPHYSPILHPYLEDPHTVPLHNIHTETDTIPLSDIQRFATVIAQIKHYYIHPVKYDTLFNNAIQGMLTELDPHSSFLNQSALKELNTATTGKFGGLGVEILPEKGAIRVISPIDDTPAKRAGIQAGDLIIRIDNQAVKSMTTEEAIEKMRGKKGTTVELTILRKAHTHPLHITLTRDIIKIETVHYKRIFTDYGYIRIAFFHAPTAHSVKHAIDALHQSAPSPLKGVILDLRNNPGGLMDAAIEVADAFLSAPQSQYQGLIVYTKGRIKGTDIQAKMSEGDILKGLPMVVLINEGSASASEIVAGALQDYHRAIVVGTRSFGKGSVQTVLPISEDMAIKLTTALYYTPSGRSIQASGIQPDIVVPALKLAKEQNTDSVLLPLLAEADLEGHIASAKKHTGKTAKTVEKQEKAAVKKQNEDRIALAKSDFQLYSAVNLIQAMQVMQTRH